jgi:hypothetical protein
MLPDEPTPTNSAHSKTSNRPSFLGPRNAGRSE